MAAAIVSAVCPAKRRPHRAQGEIDAIVLDILRQANGPISAYDIAAHTVRNGNAVVPNQVYRTIARLRKENAIVRIESLSAYVAKTGPSDVVLICEDCRSLSLLDAPEVVLDLRGMAKQKRFVPGALIIEIFGTCDGCTSAKRGQKDSLLAKQQK